MYSVALTDAWYANPLVPYFCFAADVRVEMPSCFLVLGIVWPSFYLLVWNLYTLVRTGRSSANNFVMYGNIWLGLSNNPMCSVFLVVDQPGS